MDRAAKTKINKLNTDRVRRWKLLRSEQTGRGVDDKEIYAPLAPEDGDKVARDDGSNSRRRLHERERLPYSEI
jgi:hypothetical protein